MDRENRHLNFVLKYYAPGRFDTRRALATYRSDHPVKLSLWRRYAAVAVVALLLSAVSCFLLVRNMSDRTVCLYASDAAVNYLLPDSSEVVLYPHSSLSYKRAGFGDGHRDVDMRGKAEFKVYKDPQAPFTVMDSNASVRVLGTEFTVEQLHGDSVTSVSVRSGKVLFRAKDRTEGVELTAGMIASLQSGEEMPQIIATADVVEASVHRFVFDRAPLAAVLKELSEHFNVDLSCEAKGKILTAEFETDDLDEIIKMIEKSLNVKIEKRQK